MHNFVKQVCEPQTHSFVDTTRVINGFNCRGSLQTLNVMYSPWHAGRHEVSFCC